MSWTAAWNPERAALLPFLHSVEGELRAGRVGYSLPCDEVRGLLQLPFRELVIQTELFAARVEPVVDDFSNDSDLASALASVIDEVTQKADPRAQIRLYQLLISDWRWHYKTLGTLDGLLKRSALLERPGVYAYFHWMLTATPDVHPANFALWMLSRTRPLPPIETLHVFALHERFTAAACRTIAERWNDSEDILIGVARIHQGWGRIHALDALTTVTKPGNRAWLLREGYKNRVMNAYTDYTAAVHGGLADRLASHDLDLEELIDLATILEGLCDLGPRDVDLGNYPDGADACHRLLDRCSGQQVDERLFWAVWRIVEFVEDALTAERADSGELEPGWTAETRRSIAQRGRKYLSRSDWPTELIVRWQRIVSPPVVQELDENLERFYWVLNAAQSPDALQQVVDWVTRFLHLDRDDAAQADRRRIELEALPMPGVRTGGIAGLDDPKLGSVYGQLVLYLLQAFERAPGMGIAIIRAGLASEIRFHRRAAATALRGWPVLPAHTDLPVLIAEARRAVSDAEDIAALESLQQQLASQERENT